MAVEVDVDGRTDGPAGGGEVLAEELQATHLRAHQLRAEETHIVFEILRSLILEFVQRE